MDGQCPRCGHTLDVAEVEIRTIRTDTLKTVESEKIKESRCLDCGWTVQEDDQGHP